MAVQEPGGQPPIQAPIEIRDVERLRPDELGLPPLNCGRCGEVAIVDHPCRACGYDPRPGDQPEWTECVYCERHYRMRRINDHIRRDHPLSPDYRALYGRLGPGRHNTRYHKWDEEAIAVRYGWNWGFEVNDRRPD